MKISEKRNAAAILQLPYTDPTTALPFGLCGAFETKNWQKALAAEY